MDIISSDPNPGEVKIMNSYIYVSTRTPAFTVYHLKNASTIVSGSHEIKLEEVASLEQKAWEAYKKIEPRYSNANRKLAR